MKKFLFFAFICTTFQLSAQDLQFQWVKGWPYYYDVSVCDSKDNIYLAATLYDTLHYGDFTIINQNGGLNDLYIAKFDSSFNLVWLKQISGKSNESVTGLNVDSQDNLIVSVIFRDNLVVESDSVFSPVPFHVPLLIKYAPDGSLIYHTIAAYSKVFCLHMEHTFIDNQDNILFFSDKIGPVIFSDTTVLPDDSNHYFIAKFNAEGEKQWAISTPYEFRKLSTDFSGNVWAMYSNEMYKFSGSGEFCYKRTAPYQIMHYTFDSSDNMYLCGFFDTTIVLGGTPYIPHETENIIIQKVNAGGDNIWANQLYTKHMGLYTICIMNNRLVVGGKFSQALHFDNDSLVGMMQSNFGFSIFVASYDLTGNFLHHNLITSHHTLESIESIFQNDATCYINGRTTDTIWFDSLVYVPDYFQEYYFAKLSSIIPNTETEASETVIFPNPCTDYIEIRLPGARQNTIAEVIDINGQIRKRTTLQNASEIINFQSLMPIIYLIRISGPDFSSVHRIIKL